MCKHGDTVPVKVRIAGTLSSTGRLRWRRKPIDRCIAPIVSALQKAGIDMYASCCGHDRAPGRIDLVDGRTLAIISPKDIGSKTQQEGVESE